MTSNYDQIRFNKCVFVKVPVWMYTYTQEDAANIVKELCDVRRTARLAIERYMSDFCTLCKVFADDTSIETLRASFRVQLCVAMSVDFLESVFRNIKKKAYGTYRWYGYGVGRRPAGGEREEEEEEKEALLSRWQENWQQVRKKLEEAMARLSTALYAVFNTFCIQPCISEAFCPDVFLEIPAGSVETDRLSSHDIRGLVIPEHEEEVQRAVMQFIEKHRETRDVLVDRFWAFVQRKEEYAPVVRDVSFIVRVASDLFAFADERGVSRQEKMRRLSDIAAKIAEYGIGAQLFGDEQFLVKINKADERRPDVFRFDCNLFQGEQQGCFAEWLEKEDIVSCFCFYLRQALGCFAAVIDIETNIGPRSSSSPDDENTQHPDDEGCFWVNIVEYLENQNQVDE